MTLLSYATKINKGVFLLSTTHDFGSVDADSRKPHMIIDYNRTKGGVDTVDQLCATFSVARVTNRWPMVIFNTILNISGINAQIIDKSIRREDSPKFRRVFLHNLAVGLMNAQLISRAAIQSFPKDVTCFLHAVVPTNDHGSTEEKSSAKKRKGTCKTCGRTRNTSTTLTCGRCKEFTCKQHATVTTLCSSCATDDANEDD
ncbi:uncharacterized protein LOC135704154 [Ochlerotatus camptorhynchus]|uniref:uncharacterized protein LOC135704154 n=1 Tax=Ochlerotatus camptorhynchus TaxID=644619 RepID=UPI0031D14665